MKALFAAVLAVATVVTGCQGSQGAAAPSAPRAPLTTSLIKRITVTPSEQVLAPGHTVNLMAAVYMMDGQITANVNWASSDDTVATVTASGRVTAIKEGIVTITARSALEPSRFGVCALMVSTCASCSLPVAGLVDRVDAGGVVTEAERAALNNVLSEYDLVADNPASQSYVLNKRGQVPSREPLRERESWSTNPGFAALVTATPRTTWLSSEVMINSSRTMASANHFVDGQERGRLNAPVRVLFYKADSSWVKDISTLTGEYLFVDDLPVGEVLIGRVVAERRLLAHDAWTKPFVLSKNRKTVSGSKNLIPQLDFNLVVGDVW
jgi:Bacterial Ig-like domain (group 2)